MKHFILSLWLLVSSIFKNPLVATNPVSWNIIISSQHYKNTKIVTESASLLQTLYFAKENSVMATTMMCSQVCATNKQCLSFNVFPTSNSQVCELLSENFCNKTKRIALQVWPGATVWDKSWPGMSQGCIDQELGNNQAGITNVCETGRSGCRSSTTGIQNGLSECTTCVQTCKDCRTFYNKTVTDNFKCTLWPDGSAQSPIFTFCLGPELIVVKRKIDLSNGLAGSDYRMSVQDMHRISRLNIYNTFRLLFKSGSMSYTASYEKFLIDASGALSNMSYVTGNSGDGFNLGGKALTLSPWIETASTCGSFWYLNTTLTSATLQCPGGDISIFGSVDITVTPKRSGIRWPAATAANKVLDFVEIRLG